MNVKKIILIRNAHTYDFGGGERFPVFLATELVKNHLSPIIVSRSPKLLDFAQNNNVVTVRGWWWSWQNWSGKYALLSPIYLVWQIILFVWYICLFLRHKPDIIHIQSKDDFIAATFAGKLLMKRVIWTDHADLKHIWKNIRIWNKNPVGKLVYLAALFADKITVVSKSEITLIKNEILPGNRIIKKIIVIYNGVFDTKNDYAKKTNDEFTFCVASRLVTDKGIGEVVTAFNALVRSYPSVKLILMGDGLEVEKFQKLASGNKKIDFIGHKTNPLTYINNADVFVHPTYHEGFSVALVEASMLEKPIIATGVGGNLEIVFNETTGLLVPPKDSESLRVAMETLLNDTSLRTTLAHNARQQYLEKFMFDTIGSQSFLPLYKGVKL